jgi:HEAT repeat protein
MRLSVLSLVVVLLMSMSVCAHAERDDVLQDSQSMAYLRDAVDGKDVARRIAALKALAKLGSLAAEAAPSVIDVMQDEDDIVRLLARDALVAMDGMIVPALIAALKHASPLVRKHAAEVLGKIGKPAAKSAVIPLLDAVKDRDPDVRQEATIALQIVGY